MVQKKLLGDAELLVDANAGALSKAALDLLADPERLEEMSRCGRARLGAAGALDAVVSYAENELGWAEKCNTYSQLKERLDSISLL